MPIPAVDPSQRSALADSDRIAASGGARGPWRVSMRGGDGVRWPPQAPIFSGFFCAGADFFGLFCAIFHLFSWEFAVLAAMLSRQLSALLTVPCCTIDHLHSSRP